LQTEISRPCIWCIRISTRTTRLALNEHTRKPQ
jgi:hypothetical protein